MARLSWSWGEREVFLHFVSKYIPCNRTKSTRRDCLRKQSCESEVEVASRSWGTKTA